jgi:hydrogenase 3 maturation protease
MSKVSWKKQLDRVLKRTPPAAEQLLGSRASQPDGAAQTRMRVAVMGIGNELNGDDAAGVLSARALSASLKGSAANTESDPNLLVIEAGAAPENFTGPLRRFQPDLVLLIDAADLDSTPGTIEWIDIQDADGLSASTHTLPPSVFATFLINELNCQVAVMGIQVKQVEFDQPPSSEILATVLELSRELAVILKER